jgi:hypothetical protein
MARDYSGWGPDFDIYLSNQYVPEYGWVCVAEAMACPRPPRGEYVSRSAKTEIEAIRTAITDLIRNIGDSTVI